MKKRCLRSLAALTLALALVLSMLPASALASMIMYVSTGNSGRLNLRALPSTQSESLGLYANGTAVTVDYTSGEWAYVNVGGRRGFMLLSCLTNTAPSGGGSVAPATNAPAHTENTTMYISTGNSGGLNLRANNSRSAKSLGVYSNGTKLTVLGRSGEWAYVSVSGTLGYMMLQYLTPYSPTPEPVVGPTLNPAAATTMYIATGNTGRLNLRELPSQQSRSLGLYANGTAVQAILLASGWSQVIVNGMSGFMMSKFLTAVAPGSGSGSATPKPDGTAPTAAPGFVGTMYVQTGNSGKLNLRENISTSSACLGQFANGTPVIVHATIGAWAHVTVEGQTGYMMHKFLSASAPSVAPGSGSGSTAHLPGTATVRQPGGSFVYLRSSASSNNLLNVLAKVPSGTTVEVLSWGEFWSFINYNGTQGYMVTSYLK